MSTDVILMERAPDGAWTVTVHREGRILQHNMGVCPPEDAFAAGNFYLREGFPDVQPQEAAKKGA